MFLKPKFLDTQFHKIRFRSFVFYWKATNLIAYFFLPAAQQPPPPKTKGQIARFRSKN